MIEMACTTCGEQIRLDPAQAGQTTACPHCGMVMPVQSSAVAAAQVAAVSVPAMPPPFAHAAPAPTGSKRMPVAALILGLIGLVPLYGTAFGVVGIIVGIMALTKRRPGGGAAITGIVTGGVGIILAGVTAVILWVVMPAVETQQEWMRRIECESNLQGIGAAVAMYQADYRNAYPIDLDALTRGGYLYGGSLDCPSAPTGSVDDYFYVRPTSPVPDPRAIMACEFSRNHEGDEPTRGVLYGDTSVDRLIDVEFEAALTDPENLDFAKALRRVEKP